MIDLCIWCLNCRRRFDGWNGLLRIGIKCALELHFEIRGCLYKVRDGSRRTTSERPVRLRVGLD